MKPSFTGSYVETEEVFDGIYSRSGHSFPKAVFSDGSDIGNRKSFFASRYILLYFFFELHKQGSQGEMVRSVFTHFS